MRVFLAMLLDSYRELNSKKLFWITLLLSGVVVAAFACIGITPKGLKVLFWELPIEVFNSNLISPATFYKLVFANLGVKIWLAWIATILALISTAGMIPDFIAGGAIELTLSKPISRARLLLTKFVTCLLFTALQVLVFSTAAFLLIGIRGGEWIPGLFWAVPLVVVFYSYLFCICTLVGLITRSTVASLLLTILFWVAMFALNATDGIMVQLRSNSELRIESLEKTIVRMEKAARTALEKQKAEGEPAREYTEADLNGANPLLPTRRAQLDEERESLKRWRTWAKGVYAAKSIMPKTGETVEVLERRLIDKADMEKLVGDEDGGNLRVGNNDDVRVPRREIAQRAEDEFRGRSLWWIIGTSLGFEAVILGIATLIFCRRDF